MFRLLLLLCSGVSLGFAPVPFPKPTPVDAEKRALQGEWVLARSSFAGDWTEGDGGTTAVIAGDRLTLRMPGGHLSVFRMKLGPARGGRAFDLEAVSGDDKGRVTPGIYRLQGDELTVCQLGIDLGDLRPAVFDTSNPVLDFKIFTRKKR